MAEKLPHFTGEIVAHYVTSRIPGARDRDRVVGKIESATFMVRDGTGYERTARIEDIVPATERDQIDYWMTRALEAERAGYGSMPGKPTVGELTITAEAVGQTLRSALHADMDASLARERGTTAAEPQD